ncbi:MAG: hypothetical protein NTV00_03205, partial [Methylococcales bacterium]|nr:hypothetical protein [Methylococcales bacterium]
LMFTKTKIAAATIALLSAAAAQNVSAVSIDYAGDKSQVLIFPYYNVNKGFSTSVNLRNTTGAVKAVKVRLRESNVSNDVIDFNLYMSPYDHYSFTINKNAAGNASVSTADTTCSIPHIPVNTQVEVKAGPGNYDKTSFSDASEGYIEVIEMGEVSLASVITGVTHATKTAAAVGSTPATTKGVPVNCNVLDAAWAIGGGFAEGGAYAALQTNPDTSSATADPVTGALPGLTKPTGGLQGYSILLDLVKGAAFVGDAVAIRNYSTVAQHYHLTSNTTNYLLPSLASGSELNAYTPDGTGTAMAMTPFTVTAVDYGTKDLNLSPNTSVPSGTNPFPIAQILAASSVTNDYFINPGYEAATDWVVTFPMRKHGVHPTGNTAAPSISYSARQFRDREEQVGTTGLVFSPIISGKTILPKEANVLTFTAAGVSNPVLGSPNAVTIAMPTGFVEGWGSLALTASATNNYNIAASVTSTPNFTGVWEATNYAKLAGKVPAIGYAAIRGNTGSAGSRQLGETVPHILGR